jgi:chemotaxis protein methyltransferase WspC
VYSGPAESFHQWSRNFTPAPDSGHAYVYAWVKSVSPTPSLPQPNRLAVKAAAPSKPPAAPQAAAVAVQAATAPTPQHDLAQERAQIRQLADSGQFIEASSRLDVALATRTPEAADFFLSALIALAQGNRPSAETALERALFLEPRLAEALEHLAGLREMAGRSSEAQQLRKRIGRLGSRKLADAVSAKQVDA